MKHTVTMHIAIDDFETKQSGQNVFLARLEKIDGEQINPVYVARSTSPPEAVSELLSGFQWETK